MIFARMWEVWWNSYGAVGAWLLGMGCGYSQPPKRRRK